jgi:signal peptide peptidase SppA
MRQMAERFIATSEPMAIAPTAMHRQADTGAFGFLLPFAPEVRPAFEVKGRVAVVDVRGPLSHHDEGWGDSYDGLKHRVLEAMTADVDAVLLSIDSPGGMVSGCFDCADELRWIADASGKALVAYVDGCSTSAAYALACSADEIVIPAAGLSGSVGVIHAVREFSAADKSTGVGVTVIKSGARKADGNPDEPLSDAGAVELQRIVDAQAAVFFELVARRRKLSPDAVAAWEGKIFVGIEAVAAGLADSVATEDQLLARLNGEAGAVSEAPKGQENRDMDLEEMKKALAALAEGEDQDMAKRAKSALAALDEERKEPDGDEKAEGEEPDGDEPEEKPEEDKGAKALAMVEDLKRTQLMGARADLTDSQRKSLAAVPLAALPGVLAAIPRIGSPVEGARAALGVQPAALTPNDGSRFSEADIATNAVLGINPTPLVKRDGNVMTMRACTPEEARKHLATLEGSR